MIKRLPHLMFFLLILLLLIGCGSIPEDWVRADRQTYEVIEPCLSTYIQSDSLLHSDLKESYQLLLRSWEARIIAAEELLEIEGE